MIFAEFASVCDKIRNTRSKNDKVSILASYLRTLDHESLKIVTMFLSGHTFPKGSGLDLNVGHSTVWDVLMELSNMGSDEFGKIYIKHGDLGEVAGHAIAHGKVRPLFKTELTIPYTYQQFNRIAGSTGRGSTEEKRKIVMGLLVNCSPLEARYLVKILVNELRIGLVGGLVELAIAEAFNRDLNEVREAFLVRGDIGYVAQLAKDGKLASAVMQPFMPINFMLADMMFSAKEIIDYYGKQLISEYKYDGVRAQLHKMDDEVRIFSRRLEDITLPFPEIANAASSEKSDFILDGEIVPFRNSKPLPFNELQRRLRRKNVDYEIINEIPVKYIAYDIMYLNGSSTIKHTLARRKQLLDELVLREPMIKAPFLFLDSEEMIANMFSESRDLGHEGLVLKDPDSTYQPGKRGKHWVKLKQELDTIDAVIVIAEYGHGKRAGVLSDYTFAVRDGEQLKVIGKAYSGLTDEEINVMTERLKSIMIGDEGYKIRVMPRIVLEIAFDGIQRSNRHDSGYALRFPRIKRIRDDKGVDDIDTLDKIRSLYDRRTM
ncbi:MAG: ATP-dependent DNA ligase [Nitrososphaerales archaeon]